MADVMEYKCPSCGGALEFDAASQKLKCPYCDSEFELSLFDEARKSKEDAGGRDDVHMDWKVTPGSEWDGEEQEHLDVYLCESCGGEIACEDTTAAASCPYCGSPVVMKGKLSGGLRPDYVIPFKLDKAAAKRALRQHVESKKLVPELFKEENHIDEIKGVYIPFWLFDAEVEADIEYRAERIRTWRDSNYNYTEHRHYRIDRAGTVAFEHVPVDGSRKMPDELMESIEPFDFGEAVDFKTAYLAGYLADKYDVDAQEGIRTANERIKKSTQDSFRDTVDGFSIVTQWNSRLDLKNGEAKYALYPVWMLTTSWEGKKYIFAMNGQTGKFAGDLPLDKSAYRKKLVKVSALCSLAVFAASWLVTLFL